MKSPQRDQSFVTTALNDFSNKKNQQYFTTRLKGAILKQCNTYENKCNYQEFKLALKSLKAIFQDDQNMKETKNIFAKNNDQIIINDLVQCIYYEGQNIQAEVIIFVNIDALKELIQTHNKQRQAYLGQRVKTEGDDHTDHIDITKKYRNPLIQQRTFYNHNRSFYNLNGFDSTTSKNSNSNYIFQNYIDVQQPSVFNVDTENIDEFKKIKLPRPKNLRNEINLRPFAQKDITNTTTAISKTNKKEFTLLEKIQLNHIGYHHLLALEKILAELDPENQGIADKEKYGKIVKKHMSKILNEELLQEIIDSISEGDFISCKKLSGLLDAYKFAPRFPVKSEKNNSDNFKRKMMDYDITIPKQSNVHELYVLLIEKLEEKFEKFLKAFKFFDCQQSGQIQYMDFKQTLDKLCIRFKDEEARELFNILDKKQDGFIDYEEFCQLVPNKLELEMLDRNGESLAQKTRQIYEKFGDFHNYSPDPYRVLERSRCQNPRFMDETTEKIGKEIFYTEKLKKVIENNIVVRKGRCDPGSAFKYGYNTPSDINQQFAYGIKSKNTENMFDIMNNNYSKEWTMDLENKRIQQDLMLQQIKFKKQNKNTYTNLLRQMHNTQTYKDDSRSLPKVKKLAELNQIKPVFEKTFTELKKRNHSTVIQNAYDFQDDTKSNIGSLMRELKTPNSCVNKNTQDINMQNANTEQYTNRSKSLLRNYMNTNQQKGRNNGPNFDVLNRTFTCY
ncbi:EF-hand protein (macronuclear) [Tetrahymena thermophila SB210]|uniref:EF-hand protein n=1 Tax=Tetrahymena thermophila (strain SB210) TaxID=312017 RepID=Q22NV3_TETTS|nr:EF-hand protein [Tetrahymena thermophila SB210]EAR87058.2 EF-hand protein [Tetrahymena thermophila SB210]|eukprot:XP_001007303.2 EF-hand protein [Tetrahymena thermophila SB210]